jgi:hypothetical protein
LNANPAGGNCSTGTLDNTHFILNGDALQSNGAVAGTTYNVCVQATAGGGSTTQEFTVAAHAVRNASAASAGCTGNGTSASPWNYLCIQNAVNAASLGDTVFLSGGNWRLNTAPTDTARVVINKSLNLVGVGSGNTFDTWGHVSNANGSSMCPTAGSSITCVYTAGTSYVLGTAPNDAGGILIGTITQFSLQASCNNINISHINFDAERATNGGDYEGILVIRYCAGPTTITDIRHNTYGGTPAGGTLSNPETMIFPDLSNNVTIANSMIAEPESSISSGAYQGNFVLEPVGGQGLGNFQTIRNTIFYQFWAAPTNNSNVNFTGNATYMYNDGVGSPGQDFYYGTTGATVGGSGAVYCSEVPSGTGQCIGSIHNNTTNSIFYGRNNIVAIGGGINDPTTNGALQDVNVTGNWIIGSTADIDSCVWHPFNDQGNCANHQQGMAINILVDSSCNVSNNGTPFNITNNSLIGTGVAEINVSGTDSFTCYQGSTQSGGSVLLPTTVYGVNAKNNYFSSPSNQYITNANTMSPVQTNNYCTPAAGTVIGCATTGFNTAPTVSFNLGPLTDDPVKGRIVPINSPSFTAQYGAVQWLASTSSTMPTASDARWSSNNGSFPNSAANSYIPPVSLSNVTHGDTVYMWVMDSANNISAPTSAVVP